LLSNGPRHVPSHFNENSSFVTIYRSASRSFLATDIFKFIWRFSDSNTSVSEDSNYKVKNKKFYTKGCKRYPYFIATYFHRAGSSAGNSLLYRFSGSTS